MCDTWTSEWASKHREDARGRLPSPSLPSQVANSNPGISEGCFNGPLASFNAGDIKNGREEGYNGLGVESPCLWAPFTWNAEIVVRFSHPSNC